MAKHFFIRRDFADISPFLDFIRAQADRERDALGFLPQPAYAEAARQRKLILLVVQDGDETSYAGHILFGGIFPILRVRQIAIAPRYRRHQHASTLLRTLIAQGENEGYLNIVANVATDLTGANSFYEKHGFVSSRLKAGGKTRNRKINVRILQLDTPSLISYMVDSKVATAVEMLPRKRSPEIPIYAIDLNVFFDAVKDRARSQDAIAVFEAALKHQIRVAASHELFAELKRKSNNPTNDPILSLAKTIPTLPVQDKAKIESLKPHIAPLVFPERSAAGKLKSTDESDIAHLAHAVAAGVSGYITSDEKVLAARDRLMKNFSLDVIGLSEFVHLLDLPNEIAPAPSKSTKGFRIQTPTIEEVTTFLKREGVSTEGYISISKCRRSAVFDNQGLVAVSLLDPAPALERPTHSVVCVHQEHPFSSTVADFLISEQVQLCSTSGACSLLLMDISSQPITRRIALGQGFQQAHEQSGLFKVSLGTPITNTTWTDARLVIERLSGMTLQEKCPRYDKPEVTVSINSTPRTMGLFELETLLSPTLLALPQRKAVVVPITPTFAADLLGTDAQYTFLDVPEAQFLFRRTYFNTVRAARAMIRGSIIAFYESSRGGKGRGAIVALGRIVDVTSIPANNAPELLQRGGVVDDIEALTKSDRILATTFDNLLVLNKPVSFKKLRELGCVSGANFVSATPITAKQLVSIVQAGFSDD
ncbi:GNAT family N-acetyltransferase [Bradyrhizobium sp. TM239]|uniref:GNAT family N-acetyltransferase n=1 Tax=Bradyrhizobium sp. TM239 TaxID=2599802 RepID=UPI0030C6AB93